MMVLILFLLAALLFFALYRHRYVRFGMKFFGATVFLEAADHPQLGQQESEQKSELPVLAGSDHKLVDTKS
jgi:hypothetical protein